MGESSRTTTVLLAIIAIAIGYIAYTGDGLSMVHMTGLHAREMHADSIADSIKTLQTKIDVAKRDLTRESVEDVQKRVAAYRSSLALLRTLVPEQREVNNMLDDVNMRSRVRGVRMTSFQPVAPQPGPAPFDTYAYQFSVVGHYHQVAEFLTDIASLRRIMVPGDVKLAGASMQQARAFGDTTSLLEAHFTVRTYVKSATAGDSTSGDSTHGN
ncbi:MAG TPA: type 4a pilus biogenesis protein PilO [Gemmatimonadales bacterium]|jgi:type IV pilus assembly protein PilO